MNQWWVALFEDETGNTSLPGWLQTVAERIQAAVLWFPKKKKKIGVRKKKGNIHIPALSAAQSKRVTHTFSSHTPIMAKKGFMNLLPVRCFISNLISLCLPKVRRVSPAFIDDNECHNVTNICGQRGNCTNTQGSYFCTCLPGYSSTGKAQFTPNDGTECDGTKAAFPLAPPAGSPCIPPLTFLPSAAGWALQDETWDFEDDYWICHLYFMHAGIAASVPKGIIQ